jgi:hypothetical protein
MHVNSAARRDRIFIRTLRSLHLTRGAAWACLDEIVPDFMRVPPRDG